MLNSWEICGLGRKPPPPSLGCFCAYIGGCRGISAPFIFPTRLLGGWKGFDQVLINNHTKSVFGRVLLMFLLIITPKAGVILVVFRGKHRKNNADLSPIFPCVLLSNNTTNNINVWSLFIIGLLRPTVFIFFMTYLDQ